MNPLWNSTAEIWLQDQHSGNHFQKRRELEKLKKSHKEVQKTMNPESKAAKNQQSREPLKTVGIPLEPPIPPPPPITVTGIAPPPPPQGQKRRNPLLAHWSVTLSEPGPHDDPEQIKVRLEGEIQGHPNPRFTDGEVIQSSELIALDVTQKIAKTKHTTYELGEVDPTFLEYVESIGKKLEDYNFSYEENLRKKPRSL